MNYYTKTCTVCGHTFIGEAFFCSTSCAAIDLIWIEEDPIRTITRWLNKAGYKVIKLEIEENEEE